MYENIKKSRDSLMSRRTSTKYNLEDVILYPRFSNVKTRLRETEKESDDSDG